MVEMTRKMALSFPAKNLIVSISSYNYKVLMKHKNRFIADMLDWDNPAAGGEGLWYVGKPKAISEKGGAIHLTVPFVFLCQNEPAAADSPPPVDMDIQIRAYGDSIVRISLGDGEPKGDDDNPMFCRDTDLTQTKLHVEKDADCWRILDSANLERMRIPLAEAAVEKWSDLIGPPRDEFRAVVLPDGKTEVPFSSYDCFTPDQIESLGLGFVRKDDSIEKMLFSLHADSDECFFGTGERFAKMDLAGRTVQIENADALGVNSRRAYKNIPLVLSSSGYGVFIPNSAHMRLSLADISTRAVQGAIEDSQLDLFLIGGGSIERILYHYRRLTGFPPRLPLWSYGMWMAKMTYFSAEETFEVAARLRAENFPCDVIHLDTGWFRTDWKCEWQFSRERYGDPAEYLRKMRDHGFRITLWQTPRIAEGTKHFDFAKKSHYIVMDEGSKSGQSDFDQLGVTGVIDFTNPEAVKWYQRLLERLLKMGVAAIKTDFGEEIEMHGCYQNMSPEKLHNLFSLLYQRAAFEITEKTTGEGIIWARAATAGCQRYPVHWGGDAAATWDGMAATVRGGLHLGLSGFGYWSHDVPGFHGLPDFMNSRPNDELYVRWTQLGVFTSHLRYHGTNAREPYAYPAVADIVRKWLRLRYALIPYIVDQAEKVIHTGLPIFRAMVFHHNDDPVCRHIDDQYYFGDAFLVAPVMNDKGIRNVYLPEGTWIDLWTGRQYEGPQWLMDVMCPLDKMPVYAVKDARVRIYPDLVQSTNEMNLAKSVEIIFDDTYKGDFLKPLF